MVLSWPVTICLEMYLKPSLYYWFGNWHLFLVAGVVLWVLCMYLLLASNLLSRTMAFVVLLVVPLSAFVITCELQAMQFKSMSASLISTDCIANPQKAHLEEAWSQAHAFSKNC